MKAGQFPRELPGIFDYVVNVFSLNPAIVEMGLPESQSLLARAQEGDADAYCEICRGHEARLLRQAMLLCGNETLAADLAQDTLVEGWRSVRRYNGRCQFFTWLCAIMLNRFHNTLRKKTPVSFSSLSATDEDAVDRMVSNLADQSDSPDRAAELRERAASIQESVRKLSPKHQEVIHLRFFADDSLEGVASALGCSVGTVKSRLFHALEQLRSMGILREQPANPATIEVKS